MSKKKNITTLVIDMDNVIENILSRSAWRFVHESENYCLSRDNIALMERYIRQGFTDFVAHASAYIVDSNYNANIDSDNIKLTLSTNNPLGEEIKKLLQSIVEQLLSDWALSCFYGVTDDKGKESVYHMSWRQCRAHFMILMVRDCQSNALTTLSPPA